MNRNGGNKKSPQGDLAGLLCGNTLRAAMRSTQDPLLPAREGLKELLTPAARDKATAPVMAASGGQEFSRWERCLDLLVEEFLTRKSELLRLNKLRRDQIEAYLRNYAKSSLTLEAKSDLTLESAVQSRVGSPEHEALQLFAHQSAVFQLLQTLLVKRWVDRGLLPESSLKPSGHTLNWQITTYLKKCSKQGLLGRHDWSFLKQNLFSWYSPLKDTWERLRLLLEPVKLANEPSEFPARLLQSLGARSRLSLLGFSPHLIDSTALWRLLLEQKAADERLTSISELRFAAGLGGPVLVSGLSNGESLNSLRAFSKDNELHGVWAYTDSEFERFLSEMFILWDCNAEIPRINLLARPALKELSRSHRGATLFHDAIRVPHQAELAACFQDPEGKELEDAAALLEPLRENGLLLVSSDHFWPTDTSERAERLRDQVLKCASIRLIVDLRQLTGTAGESLPKGVVLLEKCESRELRDSNRPQLLRARGHLQAHQVGAFWDCVLDHVRNREVAQITGDVNVKSLATVGEGVRLESMAAAASQQQLRSTPWLTLSDPRFYDAISRLRRSIHKAHTFGTVFRWRPGLDQPSRRGILLREQRDVIQAFLPSDPPPSGEDAPQFLFMPEASAAEHPHFFYAQVYSAPVQFWYRLETEQGALKRGGAKAVERQAEQRLKLMPLLRLFEPGTLLAAPMQRENASFAGLDQIRSDLTRIFRAPVRGMAENSRLHEIVLALESTIAQNIALCSEFTQHLFPELKINRWSIPARLPEVAPRQALEIFSHLDSSPISSHPAIQITRLRSAQDFKVTNSEIMDLSLGGISELKVFQGIDVALKLTGPTLLLRAAHEELSKRVGRPWRETSDRMRYPTDIHLVQKQLRDEILKTTEHQLSATREYLAVMDQIFCCLFGLSTSFADESARQAIRHHLAPEESRIVTQVQFTRPATASALFTPSGSESPRGILQ
jgi:hypothetical protein